MTPSPQRLRFGLFMQPVHHPRENPTLALERDLDLLEHLDRLGYDEAWIGEHHSTGWETISAPDVFIAAAAARTHHIRLGTGVVPLSIHHPLHVADRAVLLDHLTRGRFMLGVGVGGGLPSDLHVFGVSKADAQPRFEEAFDLIMRLLTTTEPITHRAEWFEIQDALLQVGPYTYPHMPLAIASNDPASLERVGRYGAQLLTGAPPERIPEVFEHIQRGADAAGRAASRDQIALAVKMHLAPSREQAIAEIQTGAAEEQFDFNAVVNGRSQPAVPREDYAATLAEREIIGTPEQAIDHIQTMLDKSGGFGSVLITSTEWAPREAIWRSYELFARYVMPHFQGSLRPMQQAATTAARINS